MKIKNTLEKEIADEIKKRLEKKAEGYAQRFNGPTQTTQKRWAKKDCETG